MAVSRKKLQEEHEKTPDYAAIGEMLHDTRMSYGLSIDAAAHALHVKPAVISALEKGKLEDIPGGLVYAKGHLRTYAQYLGVNLATMLSLLTVEAEVKPVASVSSSHYEPRRMRLAAWISAGVIVGLAATWLMQEARKAAPSLIKPLPSEYGAYREDLETPGLASSCISVSQHAAWPPCFRQEEEKTLKHLFGRKHATVMQVGE